MTDEVNEAPDTFGSMVAKFKHDGTTGETESVCEFSPDGRLFASCSGANQVILWNVEKHSVAAVLKGHAEPVVYCKFSPDGKWIATASRDQTVGVWDVTTHAKVHSLTGHRKTVLRCAFSPDSQLIATGSDDSNVKLWATQTGKEVATLAGHKAYIHSVEFSCDGTRLASCSWDSSVRIWDVQAHTEVHALTHHKNGVTMCTFSPDGTCVASCGMDNRVVLVDTASGEELGVLEGHTQKINMCAFSPDGSLLLTCSDDRTAQLWDVKKPQKKKKKGKPCAHVCTLNNSAPVKHGVFSADGSMFITSDKAVRVWRTRVVGPIETLDGHRYGVNGAVFSPASSTPLIASWAGDRLVRFFDASLEHYPAEPDTRYVGLMWDAEAPVRAFDKLVSKEPIPPQRRGDFRALEERPFAKLLEPMHQVFMKALKTNKWSDIVAEDFDKAIDITNRYFTDQLKLANKETALLRGVYANIRKSNRTSFANVMIGVADEPQFDSFAECVTSLDAVLESVRTEPPRQKSSNYADLYREAYSAKANLRSLLSAIGEKTGAKLDSIEVKSMVHALQTMSLHNAAAETPSETPTHTLDVLCGTMQCDDVNAMLTVVEMLTCLDPALEEYASQRGWDKATVGLTKTDDVHVLRVEDTFGPWEAEEQSGEGEGDGWCETNIALRLRSDQHICTVKLVHSKMVDQRGKLNTHTMHNRFESARKILKAIGRQIDIEEVLAKDMEELDKLEEIADELSEAEDGDGGDQAPPMMGGPPMMLGKKNSRSSSRAGNMSVGNGLTKRTSKQTLSRRHAAAAANFLDHKGDVPANANVDNEELRQKLTAEITRKVRADFREELESDVRHELESKLHTEMKAAVRAEIEAGIRKELEEKIRAELEEEAEADANSKSGKKGKKPDKSEAKLRKQLEAELRPSIEAEVEAKLRAQQSNNNNNTNNTNNNISDSEAVAKARAEGFAQGRMQAQTPVEEALRKAREEWELEQLKREANLRAQIEIEALQKAEESAMAAYDEALTERESKRQSLTEHKLRLELTAEIKVKMRAEMEKEYATRLERELAIRTGGGDKENFAVPDAAPPTPKKTKSGWFKKRASKQTIG